MFGNESFVFILFLFYIKIHLLWKVKQYLCNCYLNFSQFPSKFVRDFKRYFKKFHENLLQFCYAISLQIDDEIKLLSRKSLFEGVIP